MNQCRQRRIIQASIIFTVTEPFIPQSSLLLRSVYTGHSESRSPIPEKGVKAPLIDRTGLTQSSVRRDHVRGSLIMDGRYLIETESGDLGFTLHCHGLLEFCNVNQDGVSEG